VRARAQGPGGADAASLARARARTHARAAIVAETCGPYTVLPAVMNEYRVPEMNVQNGVLKVRPPARARPHPAAPGVADRAAAR